MIRYSDIHLSDLKNLSLKSFTEVLLNDYYPFIYSEIGKMEELIHQLKEDYDVELLESLQMKIYSEFDELFRKEKLVLFPYILKLDEENLKAENCNPFKNIKVHFTSMTNHIVNASELMSNYFINNLNDQTIGNMQTTLLALRENMIEIQFIKEKHFYVHYKGCGGCSIKHT